MKAELEAYGLSQKEIGVYLAGLKAGDCTANRLSELTGIRRSTVYEVAESLKKKGLMTSSSKGKKFYFSAANPKTLLLRLKEKQELIKRALPDLTRLQQAIPEKPTVELFEGMMGIKSAVEEMLDHKEILVYGAAQMGDMIFGAYTANFARKRVEKGIMLRAVIDPAVPQHMLEKDVEKFTKIKTLKLLKDHNSAYFIYGSKLIIITLGEELIAIKITSPLLAESQRQMFNLMWQVAD